MTITAKYQGKCLKCGLPIAVGDQIDWQKGVGSTHATCPTAQPTWETPAAAAPEYPPTVEQAVALALFETGRSLAVQAGAGTGKTSTLILLARSTTRRGQYIAFNRPIVDEARTKFPSNVTCSTAHSLAYKAVGYRYSHRLEGDRMKTSEIAARLGVNDLRFDHAGVNGDPKTLPAFRVTGLVVKTVDAFCQSADADIQASHVPFVQGLDAPGSYANNNEVARYVLPFARRMWVDLQNPAGVLRFHPGHYLKMWQLSGPRIQADFILFDEAQDANPVMVAIVAAQTHAQLVWVGDSQQQIYSFTGAINALDTVPHDEEAILSQSFRFGPAIAAVANVCLDQLDAVLRITGWEQRQSEVTTGFAADAILCRTNAGALEELLGALDSGLNPHLVGGGPDSDIARFARAAQDLQQGRGTSHPELACFDTWGEVQLYVQEDEQGGDLKLLVGILDRFGVDVIISALTMQPDEDDADLVISTAHKSKGREWDAVRLAGDFPDQAQGEELRLLYVAVTRARLQLDISAVAALATAAPTGTEV